MVNLIKKDQQQFFQSKKNPIAQSLKTSRQWSQKIVKSKKKYDRKTRNKFLEECKEIIRGW